MHNDTKGDRRKKPYLSTYRDCAAALCQFVSSVIVSQTSAQVKNRCYTIFLYKKIASPYKKGEVGGVVVYT